MSRNPLQFRLPPSPPSRAVPFEQLFLSHYIESFGSPRGQPAFWFDKLPELLASPVQPSVKHSIRAAGMVFYGIFTGNVSIQTEACNRYAMALHSLHSLLQNGVLMGDINTLKSADTVVCAPIMMCQFEIMASTSPDAWMQHVEAAAAMLVSRGPKGCSVGLAHQVFLTVRMFLVSNLFW